MFAAGARLERRLESLTADVFDVIVIGGGVLGAAVARDAVHRGLHTALIEAEDFAAGASWNSMKIVHGGLRYLQHADLARVRESIRERSTWLRIAAHLVSPLPVVVPTYRRELRGLTAMRAAIAVNDIVSWDRNDGAPEDRMIPKARTLTAAEVAALAPGVDEAHLTGGVMFHDAQVYSTERLVLAMIASAADAGAVIANHVAMVGPTTRRNGTLELGLEDRLSCTKFSVRARAVVNAAGAGTDAVASALLGREVHPASPPSVALNLLLRRGLGQRVAFAARARADRSGRGRELFLVPWRGQTIVGTGHYACRGDPAALAGPSEVERFMAEANGALPSMRITPDDVALVHAGIVAASSARPDGRVDVRRHPIVRDHSSDGLPGAVTAVSVKYTTARSLAERVVDLLFRFRGQRPPQCVTAATLLRGAPAGTFETLVRRLSGEARGCLPEDVVQHLAHSYGTDACVLVSAVHSDPRLGERIMPEAPVIRAELAYGRACEMARTVDDLLKRRTELGPRGLVGPAAMRVAGEILEVASA